MRKVKFTIAMTVQCKKACEFSKQCKERFGHDPDMTCLECLIGEHIEAVEAGEHGCLKVEKLSAVES